MPRKSLIGRSASMRLQQLQWGRGMMPRKTANQAKYLASDRDFNGAAYLNAEKHADRRGLNISLRPRPGQPNPTRPGAVEYDPTAPTHAPSTRFPVPTYRHALICR
jgi:hypothetical protein